MHKLHYKEYLEGRHVTPTCFSKKDPTDTCEPLEDQEAEDIHQTKQEEEHFDMNNPYMNQGFQMPYEISQNRYREQVFGGTSGYNQDYPQQRPEPLNGRRGERRADPYDAPFATSPRQPMDYNRAYRSGRPDLGYEQAQISVPYPQEPLHRHKPGYYMPPPEIGFDPYNDPVAPQRDMSEEDGYGSHPGWILLLRYPKDGDAQVRKALTMCTKHIESDGGRILGISGSHGIRVREGGEAWVTFGRMRHFGGGQWDIQQSPVQDEINFRVLAIYYPSLHRAIQWFDRDSCFKQKDFPAPYKTDCIALPLTSSDTAHSKTLVFTEYPRISHPEYFRDKFSIPTEDMMKKRFKANPYIVKTTTMSTTDVRHRVARHLRGSWLKSDSVITLSLFNSLDETHRYFTDPEYLNCKDAQDRVSAPTTVIIDLFSWKL